MLLGLIVAQTVQAQSTSDADLDRIRKALAQTPTVNVPVPSVLQEGPVFRVTVRGRKPDKPVWGNWSAVPTNVRPWFRSYHHEYLERVTPEEFRSATLYPAGLDIVPLVQFVAKQIKAANRGRQSANAKEEVRKALEEFLACRANPGRPGC